MSVYVISAIVIILVVIGIIGAIIPGIPGPPVGFVGFLVAWLCLDNDFSYIYIIVTGVLAVFITIIDYYMPVYGTKKFRGTKAGQRGSTIGLVVSLLVLPALGIVIGPFGIVGMLIGPFLGALAGELLAKNNENALKSAMGSFVGFLFGTLIKLVYCVVIAVFVVKIVF